MFIFNGICGFNPFQFVVFARTEEDARRRLLAAQGTTIQEFQGCYAQSAKDVFESSERITYLPSSSPSEDEGPWARDKTFQEFVRDSKVTVREPTAVLFSSCLDG
jgi:hypothetical protein